MTDPLLIDHDSSVHRVWGAVIGEQPYQVDVEVLAHGNEEPPGFLMFTMRPLPDLPRRLPDGAAGPMPTILLEDWFMVGADPEVNARACDLVSAVLTPVSVDEFVALGEANAAGQERFVEGGPVPGPAEVLLAPADFAGPNRAQRRAAAKGR